jgi:ferric enterobactin receptor
LLLLLALMATVPMTGHAQVADLSGVVRDSISNESLPNAVITVVGQGQRTLSDPYGRFSLVSLPHGNHVLRVEYLGFEVRHVPVDIPTAGVIAIELAPAAIELEGVTVELSGDLAQVADGVSQITLSPRDLSNMPSLGEADVFRTLQLLPGVGGTNDATSGLFVRGGTPDENLVLLDGMTIYHVDHFFGVFSAFNSDAIKDVRLYKGGFPAKYGGRTSSVVEMVGNSGDPENFGVSVGANMLSGRAVAEVPLGGVGSLLVSARRSYTDILQTPLYTDIFGTLSASDTQPDVTFPGRGGFQQQTVQPDFYFYDLNAKLTLTPSSKDILTLSIYNGEDRLNESIPGRDVTIPGGQVFSIPERTDVSGWGNTGVSARWSRTWSSRFTTDWLVATSEYFSEGALDVVALDVARGLREDNRVGDETARMNNTWRLSGSSMLEFGGQVTRSDVAYSFQQLRGDSIRGELDLSSEGTLLSGYAQHTWTPLGGLELTGGVRVSDYELTGETYVEPRASARYALSNGLQFKGAWGRYNQFVKRIENEDVLEGSRDFWLLAGDEVAPSAAEHRILGVGYETDRYLFDLEVYDKNLDQVSQFSTRARTTPDEELTDLFFSGIGQARGIEALVQKTAGAFTGWVGYTLSSVDYELEDFNESASFPASHDQLHEVKVVGTYQHGPWTFSSNWVFGSGKPYTVPEAQYPIELLDGREINYIHVGEKNGVRLPAYHRLDLSAARRFESDTAFMEVNFTLFNAYGRDNTWYRLFDLSTLPMVVTDVTTLGFTPSIGVRVGMR